MLHKELGTKNKQIFIGQTKQGVEYSFTSFGVVKHVGKFGENQCTGTDTCGKKHNVEASYLTCLLESDVKYIILDPIMSTGQYPEMLKQFDFVELILIYLHFDTPEQNFDRVISRRKAKTGLDVELSEKTKENVASKQRGFLSLYKRAKDSCDRSIKIDATLPKDIILKKAKQIIQD